MIERFLEKLSWGVLPAGARVAVHRDVEDIARLGDARYVCGDLAWLTPCAATMMSVAQPMILADARREFRLLAGFRTWQVVCRVGPKRRDLPVLRVRGRVDPEVARAIAAFDVLVRPLVTSLDASGARQIDAAARALAPGYVRPAPGRPGRMQRPPPGPLDHFFVAESLSTQVLAAIMGLSPSTVRRWR